MEISESKKQGPILGEFNPHLCRLARKIALLIALAIVNFSMAISATAADERLTVYVVNYPLQYFAERIAGDHATVVFPAPPDEDPAFWTPDVSTIAGYQQADLILLNGAGYARWVGRVSLPRSRLVNTTARFKDQYLPLKNVITHSHGAGGEHAHGDLAFTTWIDLKLATGQAGAVAAALSRKKPALKTVFQKNYAELKKDLLNLDQQIAEMATSDTGKLLVGSHPVYDYLAQRYGLNIKSVHWEPGEMQGAAQWKELETLLKEHPANWMIWEGEPLVETVGKLKARGLESVVFNPCGNIPEQGDFLSVMRRNVKNLQRVF